MDERINYYHVVEQTDEEKLAMYMKLSKTELAKMLIEANKHLQRMELRPIYVDNNRGFQEIKPSTPSWPTFPETPYKVTCGTYHSPEVYPVDHFKNLKHD